MDYEIRYSDRRTVSLKVKDAALTVYSPRGVSTKEIERIIEKHLEWINSKIAIQKKKASEMVALGEEDIKRLRSEARRYLTEKTAYYAGIMGAKYGKITISSAKTRFGSCNSKGNIAYSYRLMLYPEDAREYVVVHELAHTFLMNHSKEFYKIIEGVLPDYKRRRQLLK